MNNESSNLARIHREMVRWRILKAAEVSSPIPVSEELLCAIVGDLKLPVNQDGIRRELEYLEDKKLITVANRNTARPWEAHLTALGVDVVEYTVPAPDGIGRPPLPR